jgi:hypothetical protein
VRWLALLLCMVCASPALAQHWTTQDPCPDFNPGCTTNPVTYCDGSSIPGTPPTWDGVFDDRFASLMLYSEGYGQVCTAMAWDEHTILTAAHCLCGDDSTTMTDWDGVWVTPNWIPGDIGQETKAHIAAVRFRTGACGSYVDDIAFLWAPFQTIPGPYVSDIYDPMTEHGDCVRLVRHGVTGDYKECDEAVRTHVADGPGDGGSFNGQTGDSDLNNYGSSWGGCVDPWDMTAITGGSGGPTYAIVDPDGPGGSPEQVKIAQVSSGTYVGAPVVMNVNSYEELDGWVTSAPIWPTSAVIQSNGVYILAYFHADIMHDQSARTMTANRPIPMRCAVAVNEDDGAQVYAVGCEFTSATAGGKTVSCTSLYRNKWGVPECTAHAPAGTPGDWEITKVWTINTSGDYAETSASTIHDGYDSSHYNVGSVLINSSLNDVTPPALTSVVVSPSVAPGEDVSCVLELDSSTRDSAGCVFEAEGVGAFDTGYSGFDIADWRFSSATTPTSLTVGSTVNLAFAFATDTSGNEARGLAGADSFLVFDCTSSSYSYSAASGWSLLGTFSPVVYGTGNIDIRIKPPTGQDTIWGVSHDTNPSAEMHAGIRFASDGTIDVYDDGAWVDTVGTYTGAVWHRVQFFGNWSIPFELPVTYTVRVAPCGQPFTELASGVVSTNPYPYEDINKYQLYTSGGTTAYSGLPQSVPGPCFPVLCGIGDPYPDWDCGSPPDGCGSTVYCGDPTCGGGGSSCVDYICQ